MNDTLSKIFNMKGKLSRYVRIMDKEITKLTLDELDKCIEPTGEEIQKLVSEGYTYYGAREMARNNAYGGLPPDGYDTWGDFWKCR
jgi:hypothetical protein